MLWPTCKEKTGLKRLRQKCMTVVWGLCPKSLLLLEIQALKMPPMALSSRQLGIIDGVDRCCSHSDSDSVFTMFVKCFNECATLNLVALPAAPYWVVASCRSWADDYEFSSVVGNRHVRLCYAKSMIICYLVNMLKAVLANT